MNWENIIEIYAQKHYLSMASVKKEITEGWISKEELFEAWLEYEGIIGYTERILNTLKTISERIPE